MAHVSGLVGGPTHKTEKAPRRDDGSSAVRTPNRVHALLGMANFNKLPHCKNETLLAKPGESIVLHTRMRPHAGLRHGPN